MTVLAGVNFTSCKAHVMHVHMYTVLQTIYSTDHAAKLQKLKTEMVTALGKKKT